MKERLPSRQQRVQLIKTAMLLVFVFMVLLGSGIYYQYSKTHEMIRIDQIKNLAASQSKAAEVFLRERASLLSVLVETHSYAQLSQQEVLANVFNAINLRGDMLGLMDLGVIDEKGDQVAYVGPFDLRGLNYRHQSWFNEVETNGKFISDVYMGFRREPHFIIAVRGINGNHSWTLRATIDSAVFDALVLSDQTGYMSDAFIINAEGIYQTMPRHQGRVLEQSHISPDLFDQGTVTVEKMVIQGVGFYCAGTWLRNKDWLMVVLSRSAD